MKPATAANEPHLADPLGAAELARQVATQRAEIARLEALLAEERQRQVERSARAEEQLIRSERRFRSLVEHSPVGIWQVTADGNTIEYLNPAMRNLLGIAPAEDMTGRPIRDFVAPESLAFASDQTKLRHRGLASSYEINYLTRHGNRVPAQVVGTPVLDAEGRLSGMIGMAIDITERRQAEQELRRRASLIDNSFDGIFVWRRPGGIEFWSQGATRLYGFKSGEAIGRISHDLLQTRFPTTLDDLINDLETKGVFEGELRHITKDGQELIVSSRIQLLPDPDGAFVVLEVTRDITEQKRAQEQANKYLADLSHLERLNTADEMATGLAHELNQPLTAIAVQAGLAAELLAAAGGADETITAALAEVVRESKRAGEIIRVLRHLVQRTSEPPSEQQLNAIITDIVRVIEPMAAEAKVTIDLQLGELPTMRANRVQLGQLILNLCRNAIEAMDLPDIQRRTLTITTKLTRDRQIKLQVSDTGVGLTEESKARMFDSFYTTKPTGIGIGLAICRSFVEAHGGTIGAVNRPSGGVTFRVVLPIQ